MIRNDIVECFILRFAMEVRDDDFGRPTRLTPLWLAVQDKCGDCVMDEVLDALYNLQEECADLNKFVAANAVPYRVVHFGQVRHTPQWKDFFNGEFRIKVLPAGRVRYQKLMDQLQRELSQAAPSTVPPDQAAHRRPIGFRSPHT